MEQNKVKVKIKKVREEKSSFPQYMTSGSVGMDIYASIKEDIVINPQEIVKIPTNFALELPKNFEAQIRPRSGLATKYGVTVVNSPGTIDPDYRGEVIVFLINLSKQPYTIKKDDRIAQMIIQKVYKAELETKETLNETNRGSGGFGHTGK